MLRITNLVLTIAIALAVFASCASAYEDRDREEAEALSRDGFGRANPDVLTNGFFATWPVILIVLSAFFVISAVLSLVGYSTGICKSPYNSYAAPGQV